MTRRRLELLGSGLAIAVIAGAFGYAWWADTRSAPPPSAPAAGATRVAAPPADAEAGVPSTLFADARAGDWHAYRVTSAGPYGILRSTAVTWVSDARADGVTRSVRGRLDGGDEVRTGRDEQFPRAGLTLARLLGHDHSGWTLFDVEVTDDVRTVGDRSFACTKFTFRSRDPMFPKKVTRTERWLSPEVPAGGLVAEREVQELGDARFEISQDLIGFGTAEGTRWGVRPPEL